MPRNRFSCVSAWEFDVIKWEVAIATVIGTQQFTRMSPRTGNPDAGLITYHPPVVVPVSVTLRLLVNDCAMEVKAHIPSMDIRVRTPDEIHKVGGSHLRGRV